MVKGLQAPDEPKRLPQMETKAPLIPLHQKGSPRQICVKSLVSQVPLIGSPPSGNNGHRHCSRSRTRPPLVRKKRQHIVQEGQVPAEFDIPLEMLDQTFLEPVGDIITGGINAYRVCPLVIPTKSSQHWYCHTSKISLYKNKKYFVFFEYCTN